MLSTKINSLVSSVNENAGPKENVRLYKEIRTHLRSAEVTCNDHEKLAEILKDHLRNGSPEEKEEALQVITAICTEDSSDSVTSNLFSILISEEKLNLEEYLCAQDDWAIRSKILESVVKSSASIPPKIFLYFIHNNVVRSVFMTKNEHIRTLLSEFVLTLSSNYGIQRCDQGMQQKAFLTFKNSYVPVIEDLRQNDNRVWYRLCMFTLSYFGKLIHTEIDLINVLLSNIERGFKSKTVEDKLLSFDCWKVLIDVSNLDHSYLCSAKQSKLLLKPLKVKLSSNDQVTCRRLDVWSHLLAALQKNSTTSLEEFMNFCYEPLHADMWNNGHPTWSGVIKNSWSKRTEILMNLIGHYGHDGSCIRPETFKLDTPVITSANLLKYKSPILNALSVCSENMLFWEVKSAREKKIKCLWGSVFKIISNVDLMTKETVLRDIFVILKRFFEKSQNYDAQDYFDDILQHIFGVIVSEGVSDYVILNDLIVFPLADIMIACPDLLEYKVINFMNLFRACSKMGSRLEYFNRSCDLLKTYKQSGTQMLSAYIWLELSNELLSICKTPRDEFEEFKVNAQFLMTWICECYMPDNLEQKIFDRWKAILMEIDVISDQFKENLLGDMEKLLKENPGLSSKMLGFLHSASCLMTDKSTLIFVSKLLDIILQCTKNPCLSSEKLKTMIPIVAKFQIHITKTDKNKAEPLTIKLFECIEHFLKPHQAYETLKLLKTFLPKLPQNYKKNLPSTLHTIVTDLTTHSDTVVAQDAIALLAELERNEGNGCQTFIKPLVSTRTAKIASMSNGNVANMFAQEVSTSPVRVKGSQIANKVQRSSRTMKIANAMPEFKSSNIDLDANSSDFVFIDKEVKLDTSKFSAHQREAMGKRREDIPALYQDLSQSQHTNDSLSKGSSCAMDNDDQTKSDNFKNLFDNDKETILNKLSAHALSPKITLEPVEQEKEKTSAKKDPKKRARLSLKTTPKRKPQNDSNSDKIQNGGDQFKSLQFTDDNLLMDEKLVTEKPVVMLRRYSDSDLCSKLNDSLINLSKGKSASLESLDQSPKFLQASPKDYAPKPFHESQVVVPSDADETLCSQAIEEAQNSETNPKEEKSNSTKKKHSRHLSELQKIKMDIVGADEFIGLGRKRRSIQKVLHKFVSPRRKTQKRADMDEATQLSETGQSEPLIPPIFNTKAKSDTNSIETLGRTGRPRKSLSVVTEPAKKRGRRNSIQIDDGAIIAENITNLDTMISDDTAATNTLSEPAKRRGRKSIEINDEPTNTENISKTLEPAKRRGRKMSIQIDEEDNITNTETMNSDDTAAANRPSQPAKRRGRRKSIEMDDDDTNIADRLAVINSNNKTSLDITNTPSEPSKRRGRRSIVMDNAIKNDENMTVCRTNKTMKVEPEGISNLDRSATSTKAGSTRGRKKEVPKNSTKETGKLETSSKTRGQKRVNNDVEVKNTENGDTPLENMIRAPPSSTNNRRTRNSLAKGTDVQDNSLRIDTSVTSNNKRSRKSLLNDDVTKSSDQKIDAPNSNKKRGRKCVSTAKDGEEINTSLSNPTSDNVTNSEDTPAAKIISKEIPLISSESLEVKKDLNNEEVAPATFKEPLSKRQKPDPSDDQRGKDEGIRKESQDDDDCIIESSQPETTVYKFNRSGRKSINVKEIQNTVSDELLQCIVGDRLSPTEDLVEPKKEGDVIAEEAETIAEVEIEDPPSEDIIKDAEQSEAAKTECVIQISDTLDTCDVTASCNPDDTVASVQEVPEIVFDEKAVNPEHTVVPIERELFPISRDNILIDLDLDALPIGFDAFEKENLPGSPIGDDTTHRNSELLNSTLDISPIKETKEENEEEIAKSKEETIEEKLSTPTSTPTGFMKTASSRSAKLMNMLPTMLRIQKSPKTVVRRAQTSITSSPTTDRIKRMMLKCNDKVKVPVFDLKDDAEPPYVLEFTRDVPSPLATPNGSILKRKACEALEAGLSPLPKRKRVNFCDPPTTCEKIYFKDNNDEDSMDGISALSELRVKKSSPIYSALSECSIDIQEVLTHIRQENLLDHFLAINVRTVGDLSKLTSSQVNQLEFLNNPRLSTITTALSAFADKLLSTVQNEPSSSTEETSSQDSVDTQVSPEDVLDELRISNKVVKMWMDLKVLCNRRELEYIVNDVQRELRK